MKELIQSKAIKMSTREIAALLDKDHSNIKKSAERLASKGTLALHESKFEHKGNVYTEYLLVKRDTLILVLKTPQNLLLQ